MSTTPEITWAQRSSTTDAAKNYIYLTISVPDVSPKDLKLEIKPKNISFSGYSSTYKKNYSVELELFDEIDADQTKVNHTSKNIVIILPKKELRAEYWPRLIKGSTKSHFIRTDFDMWVDEDEQDEVAAEDPAFPGGMGGMPGMSGMGDLSSMMGGAGGDFGGVDFSKLGGDMAEDDGEDDDEEDMPSLEGDDEKTDAATEVKDATESTNKAKIEEVS